MMDWFRPGNSGFVGISSGFTGFFSVGPMERENLGTCTKVLNRKVYD
jgi:hypothetical protein